MRHEASIRTEITNYNLLEYSYLGDEIPIYEYLEEDPEEDPKEYPEEDLGEILDENPEEDPEEVLQENQRQVEPDETMISGPTLVFNDSQNEIPKKKPLSQREFSPMLAHACTLECILSEDILLY